MTATELMESLVCVKVYPTMVYFVFETCTIRATYGSRNDNLFNWHLTKSTLGEDTVKSHRIPGWKSVEDIWGRVERTQIPFLHTTQLQEPVAIHIRISDQTWNIPVDPAFATSYNELSRSDLFPFKPRDEATLDEILGIPD